MSWQTISGDKEKYQAYLCSREWCERREAVRRRSGSKCERCRVNGMDHVHHLTYARKYAEPLEDLQALCKECHEFTHGKSNYDPRVSAPVFLDRGKPIRSVYLAGKITRDNWRDEIVSGWSEENHSPHTYHAVGESGGERWELVRNALAAPTGQRLDYVGPWWSDAGACGGHGSAKGCSGPHAYCAGAYDSHGEEITPDEGDIESSRAMVSANVRKAIERCDLLFAWINSCDCFGTIFEIGYAVALKKTVVVACPEAFDHEQMWLCRQFASWTVIGDSAGEAWKTLWKETSK